MGRVLSRIALGDAGTTLSTGGTFSGSFDAVSALAASTLDSITVDGTAYTALTLGVGAIIHGNITAGSSTNGSATIALYKRAV